MLSAAIVLAASAASNAMAVAGERADASSSTTAESGGTDGDGAATGAAGDTGTGEDATALAKAARTGKLVEITSLRGESSEVYATPEGHLEAREHLRPVRTRVDGAWRDIDTTLICGANGTVAPKVTSVGLSFSGGGFAPLVRMTKNGRELALSWPTELPAPEMNGNTVTYPDVLPGVDLRMTAQQDGFTQLLVVKSAEAAASPRARPETGSASESGDPDQRKDGHQRSAQGSAHGDRAVHDPVRRLLAVKKCGGMTVKVLRSDSTGELELSGTRSELLALGRELRNGHGEILLEQVSDPFPYSRSLSRMTFRRASGKVMISSFGDRESLDVQGGPESLSLLADNIEGFASEADVDDHLHVDYYPDHDYLAEGSGSVVVAIG
ncbi:hypothetical protein [Streptomyces sp. NBC_01538]|uniref:Imm32 family immunity protein n=1 Tax=Streptomyces sp. NBC_01538 TaxID=2903897 RepID=UPI00386EAF77